MTKKQTQDTTTYLVEKRDEKLKITVPSDWKVTFGPVAVGSGKQPRNYGYDAGNGSMAIRFYESDTKQRAIFTGVTGFRDLSIPVEKWEPSEKKQIKAEKDHKGSKLVVEEQVDGTWVES
jgi:hypothetical protein